MKWHFVFCGAEPGDRTRKEILIGHEGIPRIGEYIIIDDLKGRIVEIEKTYSNSFIKRIEAFVDRCEE